ncbi:hypothetical protein OESDEN_07094 [Oesophagostomum dentatum]|uniref:Uncharacterized protein n=1 Tax=Oesophagostomum dentatum TaxID=61180 RepID=A0A0B1TCC6_OESDE|nr:hypothetical protein OESDEN_07094 [Oesophagostomum dentatum]
MHGFENTLPRCLGHKHAQFDLIAFADASTEAIATSIYLYTKSSANLIMAKGRLPPIKTKPTMSKMKLDAFTLELRLLNTVSTQLRSTIQVKNIYVLMDLEIALSWIKSWPLGNIGTTIFNRLIEIAKIIQHLQDSGYRLFFGHVSSEHPPDVAPRGLDQQQLECHFWCTEPQFLQELPSVWPYKLFSADEVQLDWSENIPQVEKSERRRRREEVFVC